MDKICMVTNRSSGIVVYTCDDTRQRRVFSAGETKKIPYSELESLVQQPGGKYLFANFLQVNDNKVVEELLNDTPEPEYWMNEENLPNWMQTCSLEEFQDGLDFAPQGVRDLIKKFAVSLPLNDYSKRVAILDQLGYDVTHAIEMKEATKNEPAAVAPQTKTRRVIKTGV